MAVADRVEIRVTAPGLNEVVHNFRDLQRVMQQARNLRIGENANLNDLRHQIDMTRQAMRQLRDEMQGRGTQEQRAEMQRLTQELHRLQGEADNSRDRIRRFNQALQEGNANLAEWRTEINESAQAVQRLAQAIQGLGNISQWTHDFATGIGDAFTSMSDMFSSNLFDWAGRKMTYMATEALVGDFSKIVSRYDIMSTFTNYMELAGVAADDAAAALQRVNEAILGLPIGLDESAQRLRRYQMFLGDLGKATNLTIGLQNAVYAGGANEQMRTTAFYQIDRLLSVGKLNTARQWNALIQGLGVSMRYVAEEMGLGYENVNKFAQGLADGSISTEDFLGALMRLGQGETVAAQKLQEALNIYKGTIESWISNIRFAAVRGGETLLKSLNSVLEETEGQGLTGYLRDIRNAMNELYAGASSWLQANPESLTRVIGAVETLMSSIQRFSASDIAVMVFENFARGIDMITSALNKLPKEDVEEFVAFATTLAGPIGKAFQAISSGAGVMLGVFQRFKDFDFEGLFDKIIRNVEILAGAVEMLLRVFSDGVMQELLAFGLVFGAPLANALGGLASIVSSLTTTLALLATAGVANAAAALGTLAGAVGTLGTTIVAALPIVGALAAALATFGLLTSGIQDDSISSIAERLGMDSLVGIESDLTRTANLLQDVDKQLKAVGNNPVNMLNDNLSLQQITLTKLDQARTKLRETREEYEKWKRLKIDADNLGPDEIDYMTGRPDYYGEWDTARRALEERETEVRDLEKAYKDLQEQERKLREEEENPLPRRMTVGDADAQAERLKKEAEDTAQAVAELADEYNKLYEAHKKATDSQLAGFEELKKQDAIQAGAVEKNVEARRAAAEAYEENLNTIAKFAALNPQFRGGLGKLLTDISGGGYENMQEAKQMADLVNEALDGSEKALGRLEELNRDYTELEERTARISRTQAFMDLVEERGTTGALEYMIEIGVTLDEVPQEVIDALVQQYQEEKERVKQALQQADAENSLYEPKWEAKPEDKWDLAEDTSLYEPTWKASTEEAEQAADQGYEALKQALNNRIMEGNLIDDESKEQMAKSWGEVFDALAEESEKAAELMGPDSDTSLTTGLNTTNSLMALIAGETIPAFSEAISLLAETITTYTTESETTVTTAITNVETKFIEAIDNMIAALDRLKAKITETANHFISEFQRVISKAQEVVQAIQSIQDALIALTSQPWVIDIIANMPDLGGLGGGEGGGGSGPHTGGLITGPGQTPRYYKRGGYVFLKPQGTDTIPAMLTPGEYVMRRGAVDQLGVPFLQRLNRLDIAGALDNLMHRFYRPSQAAYSVVNNSADNRAYNVNVYNYQSTEDYTYRVAARFAHAL